MPVLPLALLVTIRLYDSFGMPPADLRAAMLTADAALHSGAVRAAWVVCPPPGAIPADNSSGCTGLPHDRDLLVRIVRAPEGRLSADTLGFAAVDTATRRGTLATVFADRIARLAAHGGLDTPTLVGYAIAHEIGHLLLGTDAHARRGLMRAAWTLDEMIRRVPRDWRFSRDDAAQMVDAATRPAPPEALAPQPAAVGPSQSSRASDIPPAGQTPSISATAVLRAH